MSHNYSGKKILILGIGVTGISCAKYFLKKGLKPKIMDESKKPYLLDQLPKNIEYKLGELKKKWIFESDLIIISPGISSFKPILIYARSLGIEIISDIELFSREAKCPIISITGTNGKSTVATMIKKVAENSGYQVSLGGNIGFPALEMLKKKSDLYILELSSFQLENIFSLKSKIAVVLNVTNDHLDRYPKGFEQYKKVKLSIYNNAEICLIHSKEVKNILSYTKSKNYISFGSKKSDYYINYKEKSPILFYKKKEILHFNRTILYGDHNYKNALITLAISNAMKIPQKNAIKEISKFRNLPHRFQMIHQSNNISWINDSKSTNIENTKTALKNVKTKGTIRLLLGGDAKSSNFNILKKYFQTLKIKIYCFGKDGYNLSNIFKKKSIYFDRLEEAMRLIKQEVIPRRCSSIFTWM